MAAGYRVALRRERAPLCSRPRTAAALRNAGLTPPVLSHTGRSRHAAAFISQPSGSRITLLTTTEDFTSAFPAAPPRPGRAEEEQHLLSLFPLH
ncbi:hypothetical protein EYF80_039963 [Liparis tanakae]|uniref:Uncharacterized protein n=1 Tax=Liparis tanakae TaxID=230148 RepID=A0A4Z2G8G5_9TELE|nr:hypothetical protein EYF80_039963 [Liparis tanakae]